MNTIHTDTGIDFSKSHIISVDTVNLKHVGPSATYALSVLDPTGYSVWLSTWGNGEYTWGIDHVLDNDAWNDVFDMLNSFSAQFGASFGFSEFDGAVLGFWPDNPDS